MVYQLLSHLVLPLAFGKPCNWSTLQGSFHPIGGGLFLTNLIGLFFIMILFYDAYYVIPHSPMKFQVDPLSFGWVLEVMTL